MCTTGWGSAARASAACAMGSTLSGMADIPCVSLSDGLHNHCYLCNGGIPAFVIAKSTKSSSRSWPIHYHDSYEVQLVPGSCVALTVSPCQVDVDQRFKLVRGAGAHRRALNLEARPLSPPRAPSHHHQVPRPQCASLTTRARCQA